MHVRVYTHYFAPLQSHSTFKLYEVRQNEQINYVFFENIKLT